MARKKLGNRKEWLEGLWSEDYSITLTKIMLVFAFLFTILMMCLGPLIVNMVMYRQSPFLDTNIRYFFLLVAGYLSGIDAILCIGSLFFLLHRIGKGMVFDRMNVRLLHWIGWEVWFAAAATLLAGFTCYVPFLAIGIACVFVALIIRVIRNAFGKAVEMQDELDFTV